MLILILFAQLLRPVAEIPEPILVQKPVPHWTCPGKFFVPEKANPPVCQSIHVRRAQLRNYNPEQEEKIHWGFMKIVPKDGTIRVSMPEGFTRVPGCTIEDKTRKESKIDIEVPVTMQGFTFHAIPGHKLAINCQGYIPRVEPQTEVH
jgi:hypothetical protein